MKHSDDVPSPTTVALMIETSASEDTGEGTIAFEVALVGRSFWTP